MTEQLFLTLLISVCTKTNDLNYSHYEIQKYSMVCMAKLTECAYEKDGKILSLKEFMKKCEKAGIR